MEPENKFTNITNIATINFTLKTIIKTLQPLHPHIAACDTALSSKFKGRILLDNKFSEA